MQKLNKNKFAYIIFIFLVCNSNIIEIKRYLDCTLIDFVLK